MILSVSFGPRIKFTHIPHKRAGSCIYGRIGIFIGIDNVTSERIREENIQIKLSPCDLVYKSAMTYWEWTFSIVHISIRNHPVPIQIQNFTCSRKEYAVITRI